VNAVQVPAAISHVETAVPAQAQDGLVLRYGGFYGPGTGEFLVEAVRKVPVIGGGTGIWSFIEITDAAGRRSPRSNAASLASTTS
jgi:hypothetical protein